MSDYDILLDDLSAEQDSVADVLAGLPEDGWRTPTPATGWLVRDQVFHLWHYDDLAALSITDPNAFIAVRDPAFADPTAYERGHLQRAAELTPTQLYDSWMAGQERVLQALASVDAHARIAWFGPPMSARSFATARLMETWAHGTDVREALQLPPSASPRLRHVAHIGVITRGWSFRLRELAVPPVEPRVELTGPDGQIWAWGPEASPESVTGPALDFALLVTQRVHRDDTALVATGEGASHWLNVAQAFAGVPGPGRPPRSQRNRRSEHA